MTTTLCCNYEADPSLPYPVFWNPYNGVVQCHACGHQYEPVKIPSIANEPDIGEWLGPVAVAGIEAAERLRDAIQKSIETAAVERLAKSLIPRDLPLPPP